MSPLGSKGVRVGGRLLGFAVQIQSLSRAPWIPHDFGPQRHRKPWVPPNFGPQRHREPRVPPNFGRQGHRRCWLRHPWLAGNSRPHQAFLRTGAEDGSWEGHNDRWWVYNHSGVSTGHNACLIGAGHNRLWTFHLARRRAPFRAGISVARHCSETGKNLEAHNRVILKLKVSGLMGPDIRATAAMCNLQGEPWGWMDEPGGPHQSYAPVIPLVATSLLPLSYHYFHLGLSYQQTPWVHLIPPPNLPPVTNVLLTKRTSYENPLSRVFPRATSSLHQAPCLPILCFLPLLSKIATEVIGATYLSITSPNATKLHDAHIGIDHRYPCSRVKIIKAHWLSNLPNFNEPWASWG